MKNVKQFTTTKGTQVKNQFVITEKTDNRYQNILLNIYTFQSYDSPVVEVNEVDGTITFFRDWNFSATTSKHRNDFLKQHFNEDFTTHKIHKMQHKQQIFLCGETWTILFNSNV